MITSLCYVRAYTRARSRGLIPLTTNAEIKKESPARFLSNILCHFDYANALIS